MQTKKKYARFYIKIILNNVSKINNIDIILKYK